MITKEKELFKLNKDEIDSVRKYCNNKFERITSFNYKKHKETCLKNRLKRKGKNK
jgi:hypothetical protein